MSNHPRVSFSEASQLIKNIWENRHLKQKPLFLEGARGVGKTQMIAQIAKELSEKHGVNVETKTVTLSVLEAPDVGGFPYIDNGVTRYGRPHFMPNEGYGIIFFDEGNRGGKDIQNALLTLVEDRCVNGHRLGDGWVVVFAGNPVTQGNSTGPKYDTRTFDDALKDRLAFYSMEPRVQEVLDYFKGKYGASNKVVSWLICEPGMVCMDGVKPTSPRSLEYLIRALEVQKGVNLFTVAAGQIGQDAAFAFTNFCQNPHTLKVEHLFNITSEIEDIIVDTQKNPENVATLNYWTDLFVSEMVKRSKDNKLENLDFLKMPELKEKAAKFMGCIKTADWIDSFQRKIGEHFEQTEENLPLQYKALHDVNPDLFRKNYKEATAVVDEPEAKPEEKKAKKTKSK